MSLSLVICGTGAHARKVAACARLSGWTVRAFADERLPAHSPLPDVPVLSARDLRPGPAGRHLFVAIGSAAVRRRLIEEFAAAGWHLPSLVHPQAYVASDAWLGEGVLVAAMAVVESGSRVERGTIVDIGVVIDHDCRVEAFCHLRRPDSLGPGVDWPAESAWPAPAGQAS